MNPPSRGKPRPPAPSQGSIFDLVARRKAGIGGAAVLLIAAAGAAWLWSIYGPRVRMGGQYALPQESIALVGAPNWVKTDLKNDVLRSASLDGPLSVDDPELSRRIARAFAMHPWVKQVVGVELLHPPGARVEIICREPVAMVKVEGGVLPVDSEGVVLPSDGFTAEDAAKYPKIVGIGSSPQGPAGTPWGDEAVEEGAAIATLVQPELQSLGVLQMRFETTEGARGWVLGREEGGRILFGGAPGKERSGEPPAAAKIARLRHAGPAALDAGDSVDLTVAEPAATKPDGTAAAGAEQDSDATAGKKEATPPTPVPLGAPPSGSPGSGDGPPSGTTRTGSTPTS